MSSNLCKFQCFDACQLFFGNQSHRHSRLMSVLGQLAELPFSEVFPRLRAPLLRKPHHKSGTQKHLEQGRFGGFSQREGTSHSHPSPTLTSLLWDKVSKPHSQLLTFGALFIEGRNQEIAKWLAFEDHETLFLLESL